MEIVPRLARRARVVLTVSEHARNDLIEGLGLPEDRVFVTPNMVAPPPPFSADDEARGASWLEGHGITGPFLLYLGNLHRRKNVVRTVRAFIEAKKHHPELADHQMAIAGAAWWGSDAEHEATTDAPPGSVVYLGRVDDWQREVVLHLASALSYVSVFEGFGLPPLEAMARETPVITSNATSLPEVVGDAAVMVDPFDEHAIAEGITRILTDTELRDDLVTKGVPRAAAFTPERTGRAAMHAFRAALDGG
jgi:glycosyltransferase involved in cell wall biosynthesis